MFPLSVLFVSLIFEVGFSAHIDSALLNDQRIIGGVLAEIKSHPYQLTYHDSFDRHACGASIISRKWAITAAHCITHNAANAKLGAGSNHRYNTKFYNILRNVKHPQYDGAGVDYDIALLEIEDSFDFGQNIQPIKLANQELKAGELVNVTGWGNLEEGGSSSDLLMRVTVPIVDRAICIEAYKEHRPITERMICAGLLKQGGKDSCQGDSGGPLTANGVLYGIVSWGYGCARPNYPGIYTNVANLRSWIASITGI